MVSMQQAAIQNFPQNENNLQGDADQKVEEVVVNSRTHRHFLGLIVNYDTE